MIAARLALPAMLLGLVACGGSPAQTNTAAGPKDVDADGIVDVEDECVTEKEDGLAPRPKDGCKTDPNDQDDDGIAQKDKCPREAETRNGYQDLDGCPDELPADVVEVTTQELRCDAQILFARGKAVIEPASAPLLETIAAALKQNPAIELLEIAGHADATGDPMTNIDITRRRADAVLAALAERGIEKQRMRAAGYGSYCPLVPGKDDEANEKNRRVELKIVTQSGKPTGVSLGCAAAESEGIRPAPTSVPAPP